MMGNVESLHRGEVSCRLSEKTSIADLIDLRVLASAEPRWHILKVVALFCAHKGVFVFPFWLKICGQDDERKQDFAKAREMWCVTAKTYP
jgi:predicted ATPase